MYITTWNTISCPSPTHRCDDVISNSILPLSKYVYDIYIDMYLCVCENMYYVF